MGDIVASLCSYELHLACSTLFSMIPDLMSLSKIVGDFSELVIPLLWCQKLFHLLLLLYAGLKLVVLEMISPFSLEEKLKLAAMTLTIFLGFHVLLPLHPHFNVFLERSSLAYLRRNLCLHCHFDCCCFCFYPAETNEFAQNALSS